MKVANAISCPHATRLPFRLVNTSKYTKSHPGTTTLLDNNIIRLSFWLKLVIKFTLT